MCNNNFIIIIINKNTGIVSLIILHAVIIYHVVTVQLLRLKFGPSFLLRHKIVEDFHLTLL